MSSVLFWKHLRLKPVLQTLARLTDCPEPAGLKLCAMRTAAFSGVASLLILGAWCAEGLLENLTP